MNTQIFLRKVGLLIDASSRVSSRFYSRFDIQTKVQLYVPIKNAPKLINVFLIYFLRLWIIFVDSMDGFDKSFYSSFDAHPKIQNLMGL